MLHFGPIWGIKNWKGFDTIANLKQLNNRNSFSKNTTIKQLSVSFEHERHGRIKRKVIVSNNTNCNSIVQIIKKTKKLKSSKQAITWALKGNIIQNAKATTILQERIKKLILRIGKPFALSVLETQPRNKDLVTFWSKLQRCSN